MNPHDDRLQIPPPPECESCPHDRREKGGDGHTRYWCASAMPRHPGCVEHPDNRTTPLDAALWERKK